MIGVILINYVIGLLIGRVQSCGKQKKAMLLLTGGIILNLGALIVYKYLSFLIQTCIPVLNMWKIPISDPGILLPIGISFYIFQTMSYLIDVYRQDVEPQKNIVKFALYVSLFPQLIAGPIVRYITIAADFADRKLHLENVYSGLQRFTIGLAKKVLIADSMAFIADQIFDTPVADTIPTPYCWLGAIAYTLQIYYDFSGYSDMAIGLGRIFNFHFLENFNFPYSASSVQDFWHRWHISLSSWFRDYLYIPLGGSRKGKFRTYRNLFTVFLLCGLWHGAAWNFVFWGAYHGLALCIERIGFRKILERLPAAIGNLYVWLFAIIGWVFFRASSLDYAMNYLRIMFTGNPDHPVDTFVRSISFVTYSNLFIIIIGIVLAYPSGMIQRFFAAKSEPVKAVLLFLLFFASLVFAMTSQYSPFIYFRF